MKGVCEELMGIELQTKRRSNEAGNKAQLDEGVSVILT
jgi:hypothetical protein